MLTLLLDTIQAQTEDFEVTTGGGSAARIRTLERGLKEERRRLANMEQELRAAKKKKESQVEYSFLKRHSSALDAAVARLGEQAERDARSIFIGNVDFATSVEEVQALWVFRVWGLGFGV